MSEWVNKPPSVERTITVSPLQLQMLRKQERLVANVQSVLSTMVGVIVAGHGITEAEVLRIVDEPPGLVLSVPDPAPPA